MHVTTTFVSKLQANRHQEVGSGRSRTARLWTIVECRRDTVKFMVGRTRGGKGDAPSDQYCVSLWTRSSPKGHAVVGPWYKLASYNARRKRPPSSLQASRGRCCATKWLPPLCRRGMGGTTTNAHAQSPSPSFSPFFSSSFSPTHLALYRFHISRLA